MFWRSTISLKIISSQYEFTASRSQCLISCKQSWSGTRGNISSLKHATVVVVNVTQTASSIDIAQVCLGGPFYEESL